MFTIACKPLHHFGATFYLWEVSFCLHTVSWPVASISHEKPSDRHTSTFTTCHSDDDDDDDDGDYCYHSAILIVFFSSSIDLLIIRHALPRIVSKVDDESISEDNLYNVSMRAMWLNIHKTHLHSRFKLSAALGRTYLVWARQSGVSTSSSSTSMLECVCSPCPGKSGTGVTLFGWDPSPWKSWPWPWIPCPLSTEDLTPPNMDGPWRGGLNLEKKTFSHDPSHKVKATFWENL